MFIYHIIYSIVAYQVYTDLLCILEHNHMFEVLCMFHEHRQEDIVLWSEDYSKYAMPWDAKTN